MTQIDPMKVIEYYKNQLSETNYNLIVQQMANVQLQEKINYLIANHPELKKEVQDGADNKPTRTGSK